MDDVKPNKGRIDKWFRVFTEKEPIDGVNHIGYYIVGRFLDHPPHPGELRHTSQIMKRDGCDIETMNSHYSLVGDEIAS